MTTTARHAGRCRTCGEGWDAGDDIRRQGQEWRHDVCPDDGTAADDLTPRHPICTTCWLDHPEGACDR